MKPETIKHIDNIICLTPIGCLIGLPLVYMLPHEYRAINEYSANAVMYLLVPNNIMAVYRLVQLKKEKKPGRPMVAAIAWNFFAAMLFMIFGPTY